MLAAAYRSVMAVRASTPTRFMRLAPISAHKLYGRLGRIAFLMRRDRIAPVSWVLFSFDVYEQGPAFGRTPTAKWVFSPTRIEKRAGWFEQCRADYEVSSIVAVPEQVALLDDYRALMRELEGAAAAGAAFDRAALLAILDRYFPGREYERRRDVARIAAHRLQSHVDAAVARGEIWAP